MTPNQTNISYKAIGLIHSPFKSTQGMPIQPTGGAGIQGQVEIFPEFADGLKDLDGFSHIILLYHFHQVKEHRLRVTPFLDTQPRGLFATRAPKRPNPLGLSIVKLISIQDNLLTIENVDILDGTPLLDLKPYIPDFDNPPVTRIGWLENNSPRAKDIKADDRFN